MRPLSLSFGVVLTLLLGVGSVAGALLFVAVAVGLQNMGGGASFQPILFAVVAALLVVGGGLIGSGVGMWRGRSSAWPIAVALNGLVLVGVVVAGATGGFSAPLVAGIAISAVAVALLLMPASREALGA